MMVQYCTMQNKLKGEPPILKAVGRNLMRSKLGNLEWPIEQLW